MESYPVTYIHFSDFFVPMDQLQHFFPYIESNYLRVSLTMTPVTAVTGKAAIEARGQTPASCPLSPLPDPCALPPLVHVLLPPVPLLFDLCHMHPYLWPLSGPPNPSSRAYAWSLASCPHWWYPSLLSALLTPCSPHSTPSLYPPAAYLMGHSRADSGGCSPDPA